MKTVLDFKHTMAEYLHSHMMNVYLTLNPVERYIHFQISLIWTTVRVQVLRVIHILTVEVLTLSFPFWRSEVTLVSFVIEWTVKTELRGSWNSASPRTTLHRDHQQQISNALGDLFWGLITLLIGEVWDVIVKGPFSVKGGLDWI